ncbi:MAG: PKD domain-containing protein [Vicinamibacterales bacterium]
MKPSSFVRCIALALVGLSAACTMKQQEAPELAGPSEFGTAISISVTPDVLQQDGASQSVVTVTARGPNGAPLASVPLRAEIIVGGTLADFGSLSARSLVTGSDGRATTVYTAPPGLTFQTDDFTIVTIAITPVGGDFGNSAMRSASLRLVPRGVVVPPAGLQPSFTMAPSAPTANQTVLFNAAGSQAPANNPIASYSWNFGDGESASGRTVDHSFDGPGTYVVTLTISDALGRSASTSQSVTAAPGVKPTADFTFSPTDPLPGRQVHFNASESLPAPGRQIVQYSWDFGDGTSGKGVQVSHTYPLLGNYTVTLTVIDDAGQRDTDSQELPVEIPDEESLTGRIRE